MDVTLADKLAYLAQCFNEHTLDVPDGLLDRGCVFRLNGVAYEDTMGRSVNDPIVRMVARGPAAYRFLAQAVRYALPDATLAFEDVQLPEVSPGLASATAQVRGTLRGGPGRGRIEASAAVALLLNERGVVREAAVMIDEQTVRDIGEARRR